MRIPYFQVNAFTTNSFGGNPAGVCPLTEWLPDDLLQKVAVENDCSETAYFVPEQDHFRLRWFTPAVEVDLCGHATLASAFVLFSELRYAKPTVHFQTLSGVLKASRRESLVELDFPSRPPGPCAEHKAVSEGLGGKPLEVLKARDYLAVYSSADQVAGLNPSMPLLAELDSLGVIATAPGEGVDFVSRFFAPRAGVPEDPVTGSAHCTLIPYWASRLGKTDLTAKQISHRGGDLFCRLEGDRVAIGGKAVVYCRGELDLDVP